MLLRHNRFRGCGMTRAARQLRAVTDAEAKPRPKPRPKSIRAAADGSERDLLVAMRTKIAAEIDNGVAAAYLAPLSRQLREVDKEIRLLDHRAKQEASEDDGADSDESFDPTSI